MATIYKIKIKTVSPFCAYTEKDIKEMFEKFLKEYRDKDTKMGFESTEIEVERSYSDNNIYDISYWENFHFMSHLLLKNIKLKTL